MIVEKMTKMNAYVVFAYANVFYLPVLWNRWEPCVWAHLTGEVRGIPRVRLCSSSKMNEVCWIKHKVVPQLSMELGDIDGSRTWHHVRLQRKSFNQTARGVSFTSFFYLKKFKLFDHICTHTLKLIQSSSPCSFPTSCHLWLLHFWKLHVVDIYRAELKHS